MTTPVLPFRYSFSDADIEWVTARLGELLRGGHFLTLGRYGDEFADEFRALHGAPHAVPVCSGTAALELALRGLGVEGREVIVPTNTFGATPVAVLRAGGVPVLADVAEDMSLCPNEVARRWTPRTGAVVAVHIGGVISPHVRTLQAMCEARGVPLVEDAAHAAGASLDGIRAGNFGVAAAFSFFNTKIITCGEGGMILSRDAGVRDAARFLRDHAKDVRGAMAEVGYNWRLSEAHALLGLTQVRRLDEIIAARGRIAAAYDRYLEDVPGITLLTPPPEAVHNRYKYVVLTHRLRPDQIRTALKERFGVPLGGSVYEVPCHQQEAFRQYASGGYPVADRLCGGHVCPPIYQDMTPEQVELVGTALRSVLLVGGTDR